MRSFLDMPPVLPHDLFSNKNITERKKE